MTGWSLVSAGAAAGATWTWQSAQLPDLVQLRAAAGVGRGPGSGALTPGDPPSGLSVGTRRSTAVGAAAAAALVLPGPLGWVVGAALALVLDRWLAGQPNRAQVAKASALRRQLPLALELTSAALASGATTGAAVLLAAGGCGPPISRPLQEIAASLGLGAPPDEAWAPALSQPSLQQLGRLALRSTTSGAAMAGACRDLARHEREALLVESQVAVKRAGVLTTLPLALCFLPSFVLVGIVPIVVGLLRSMSL